MAGVTTSPFGQRREVTRHREPESLGAGEGTRPYVFAVHFVYELCL